MISVVEMTGQNLRVIFDAVMCEGSMNFAGEKLAMTLLCLETMIMPAVEVE